MNTLFLLCKYELQISHIYLNNFIKLHLSGKKDPFLDLKSRNLPYHNALQKYISKDTKGTPDNSKRYVPYSNKCKNHRLSLFLGYNRDTK